MNCMGMISVTPVSIILAACVHSYCKACLIQKKIKIFSSIESVIEHFSTVLYTVLYCCCGVLFINL